MRVVPYHKLEEILAKIFMTADVSQEDAEGIASALVRTEAKGVFSHGAQLVDGYTQRLSNGVMNLHPEVKVTELGASIAVIDGDNGLGYPVTKLATEIGIRKAKETGCATIAGTNLNHFGAALVYADMAVKENLIVSICCNTIVCVAPFGSREKYFGTNPWTFGAPCGNAHPYILDMATTVGAANKLVTYAREGKPAPEGWGIDAQGNPTTDVWSILRGGCLVPFGGPKGSGLAGMIGIMAGVASGAAYRGDVSGKSDGEDKSTFGFMMQFIDPSKLMPIEEYNQRAETYVTDILNLAPAKEGGKVLYPGYLEGERLKKAMEEGINLIDGSVIAVENAAKRVGLDPATIWD